jgi:hypothetical protein
LAPAAEFGFAPPAAAGLAPATELGLAPPADGPPPRPPPASRRTGGAAAGTVRAMVSWGEFEAAEPDLAARVQELLDAGRHKTIATLRADGSPRISGIECEIADGELTFGSMPAARKGADLRRDPRFALHGPTFHPVEGKEAEWPGEAKVAGRARPAGAVDGEADGDAFVADVTEVVVTGLDPGATKLVVDWWTPDGGRHRIERE